MKGVYKIAERAIKNNIMSVLKSKKYSSRFVVVKKSNLFRKQNRQVVNNRCHAIILHNSIIKR